MIITVYDKKKFEKEPLSLIGSIKILTYRIQKSWVYLPYLPLRPVLDHHGNSSMTWQCDKLFKIVFVVENIIMSIIYIRL